MSLADDLEKLAEEERLRQDEVAPRFFAFANEKDRAALEALVGGKTPPTVHDTIAAQLAELVETRAPAEKLTADEIRTRSLALAGGDLRAYGSWVHFPWSRRIVHVLPEREYEELRTSRNRNKITRAEQDKLRGLRVGIAGLSVGQSTAIMLALEGVGGHFRIADFDVLSLSNMNRLRAGAHEIGVKKTSLVAREIYEINPYAKIEIFDRGITDESLPLFFGEKEPLDLLFEECDDLKMKVRLRIEARKRKIPVLMETSDRGLFDVERFDLEPARAPFHGLVGELDPEKLSGMTTYEKVPIVLAIIGAKTMSKRMAASLVDIDATLKTWPQLASAVALGGAINTDAARRVALGTFRTSGRFFVDIEGTVNDAAESAAPSAASDTIHAPPLDEDDRPTPVVTLPHVHAARSPASKIPRATIERLVTLAALAPSGGNCQPWRFRLENDVLHCIHDLVRSKTFLDFENRATYAAFGALSENLRLGASSLGLGVDLTRFPKASDPFLICDARLGGAPSELGDEDRILLSQIETRVTNRKLAKRTTLPEPDASVLRDIAKRAGATLTLVTDGALLDRLGDVLGMGERLRLMNETMHHEMMGELRWSKEETQRKRDGLDLATLELTPTDEAGMRLIADWSVMEMVRRIDGGHGLASSTKKSIASACAIGLIAVPRDAGSNVRDVYFSGGIALERVWLMATAKGYAVQPMTALPYLFARLEDGRAEGLDERERRELAELRARYRALFGIDASSRDAEVMLFRLAVASAPSARSLRRTVEEILDT